MLLSANQSIADRDKVLTGLSELLDPEAVGYVLTECGIPIDGPVVIEYLRYKPGRRCICLVNASVAGSTRQFVLNAFSEAGFAKQLSETTEAVGLNRCWQEPEKRIRIDQFPFDPALRHIQKCHDQEKQRRLLRRILGFRSISQGLNLKTLAYKPGRRYVVAGRIAPGCNDSCVIEPLFSVRFYSKNQYLATRKCLQSVQSMDFPVPKIQAINEHYRTIALDWLPGRVCSEMIASGIGEPSHLSEVGHQLAELHHCSVPGMVGLATAAHSLAEVGDHLCFLCPEMTSLICQTLSETQNSLKEAGEFQSVIHGDFYAKQILIGKGEIRFIDFDQSGLGNPYQDVGNFVAKLFWQIGCTGRNQSIAEFYADAFLDGYRSNSSQFHDRAYRAHLATGIIRCALHPFRRARENWQHETFLLLTLARNCLNLTKTRKPIDATFRQTSRHTNSQF